jgi:formamidopyrimidine-DNA glycosylase
MPELPEVEVVRQGLQAFAVARPIADVEVHHPRAIRRHAPGASDFAAALRGATLRCASRRGKYLWLPIDRPGSARDAATGVALVAHLGMSGQLLMVPRAEPDEGHLRVRIRFGDGGADLRFVDQRTFGGLVIEPLVPDDAGGALPEPVAHIARDLLDPLLDVAAVVRRIRRKRSGIKRVLLDQTVVSGVGNIYADESLWRARIHPCRGADTLSGPQVRGLLDHARDVMVAALREGGTSFDALYVDVNGQSGYFDRSLAVYGRAGEPCHRCGRLIVREAFMNRSSHRCPGCQRTPRAAALRT